MNENEQGLASGNDDRQSEGRDDKRLETAAPERDAGSHIDTVSLDDAPRSASSEYADSNVSVVREGIRRHGEPFLAYLILDGVEQRSSALLEEFDAHYYGWWPSVEEFIKREFTARDLQANLDQWLAYYGLAPGVLTWDYDELSNQISQDYRMTERLGGVYVFTR